MGNYVAYNPDKVSMVLNNVVVIREWGEGATIKIAYNKPRSKTKIGKDGKGRIIKSKDRSGTVTISLQACSVSIPEICALEAIGEPYSILIADRNTNADMFFAEQGSLENDVPFERGGDDLPDAEIVFNFISGEAAHTGAKEV